MSLYISSIKGGLKIDYKGDRGVEEETWISALLLIIIIGEGYFFLKFNRPLEIGTLASSEDNRSVVGGVGNKGFSEVKLLDVSVNNKEKPLITRLHVSNATQGFIIIDDDTNELGKNIAI
ncbi:Uncharacterised protein [Bacillus freudenreichii]|nr:Uncharacterised protein [Bacillus freudenreichii]